MTSFVNDKYDDASAEGIPPKEQHSVIHFLWAKGLCTNTIHSELHQVYGDKCFTRPVIHAWCRSLHVHEKVLLMKKDLTDVFFDD